MLKKKQLQTNKKRLLTKVSFIVLMALLCAIKLTSTDSTKVSASNLTDLEILSAASVPDQNSETGYIKKIYGRINKPSLITENNKIKIYFKQTKDSNQIDIGKATISENAAKEKTFYLELPYEKAGYVQAVIFNESKQITESKWLENSTFTVTRTSDETDATPGDGLCDNGSGQCTFRAAITEANALLGSDNIYFSIPLPSVISDPNPIDNNYLDMTGIEGDDTGGNDFWSITPATALPQITEETHIDASTQTSNVKDSNTNGPEIELNGEDMVGGTYGISFSAAGSGSLNALAINRFTSRTAVEILGSNTTITRNYIGYTPDGLSGFDSSLFHTYSVFVSTGSGIIIGNNKTDGNVLTGNTASAIYVNGSAGTIIRGNIINLDKNADELVSTTQGITADGNVILEIGGPTLNEGNIINATKNKTLTLSPTSSDTVDIQIYNNIFGANAAGEERSINSTSTNQINTGSAIVISSSAASISPTQKPIIIGGSGLGNYFQGTNGRFVAGIYAAGARDYIIEENYFSNLYYGIYIANGNSGYDYNTEITNNIVGNYSSTAPRYGFQMTAVKYTGIYAGLRGVEVTGNDVAGFSNSTRGIQTFRGGTLHSNRVKNSLMAIWTTIFTSVKGNLVENSEIGIFQSIYRSNRNSTYPYTTFQPIGGQLPLSGSKCGTTEANCIYNNNRAGIYIIEHPPTNEATLYDDNDFGVAGNGQDGNYNIITAWTAMPEVLTGTARRTDISSMQYQVLPNEIAVDTWFSLEEWGFEKSSLKFFTANCFVSSDCPAAGTSTGTNGQSAFLTSYIANPGIAEYFPHVREYYIDNTGNRTNYPNFYMDSTHIATTEDFSSDGNSTTDPVTADIGEIWSSNTTATRNIATGDLGQINIPQVTLVDANPIRQSNGSFIIYVDTAGSTDNVSVTGIDDGYGTYSGGGISGPDGISNAQTTQTEADYVAAQMPGETVNIYNYITPLTPDYQGLMWRKNPLFRWSDTLSSNINYYRIYLGNTVNSMSLIGTTAGDTTEYTYSNTAQYGNHFWRVEGYNSSNQIVSRSENIAFEIVPTVIGADELIAGINIRPSGGINPIFNLQEYNRFSSYSTLDGDNGCLTDPELGTIADQGSRQTTFDQTDKLHDYEILASDELVINNFEITVYDWGDYLPFGTNAEQEYWLEANGYDRDGNLVDTDRITFTSNSGLINSRPSNEFGNLATSGDACTATLGQPGRYRFTLSGTNIKRVTVKFKDLASMDPNVGFGVPIFTLADDPEWPPVDDPGAVLSETGADISIYLLIGLGMMVLPASLGIKSKIYN